MSLRRRQAALAAILIACCSAWSPALAQSAEQQLLLSLPAPLLDLDFMTGALPGQINFARASGATCPTSTGTVATLASNAPCLAYTSTGTPAPLGLLDEEQRTNGIRNSDAVGAVPGSPGTFPVNWSFGATSGISFAINAAGSDNGLPDVEITGSGTSTGTQAALLPEAATNVIPAAVGQTWATSAYLCFVGSTTNVIGVQVDVRANDSGGSALSVYPTPVFTVPTCPSVVQARFGNVITLTDATAAFVRHRIVVNFVSGVAVNFVLRIAGPQLEQGNSVTSLIRTAGSAATRAATLVSVPNPGMWLSPTGFTLSAEYMINALLPVGVFGGVLTTNDISGVNNRVAILYNPSGVNGGFVEIGGAQKLSATTTISTTGIVTRAAVTASIAQLAAAVNGQLLGTAAGGQLALQTNIWLGASNGVVSGSLYIRRARIYPPLPINQLVQVAR